MVVITIQSITNTGLFEGAKELKKNIERKRIVGWLNLKLNETPIIIEESKISNETIVVIRQNIEEHKNELGKDVMVEEISNEEDGEQVESYFYTIVDNDIYKVDLTGAKLIGKSGKLFPVINIKSITNTTDSITVQVTTKRNKGGKIEYYIREENEEDFTLKETTTEEIYTYNGLEQDKKYNIKIVAVAENKETVEVYIDKAVY